MSAHHEIKGWCPGALRPMESGDGWVVRVRPRAGQLTQTQGAGIAAAAQQFGNGMLDISSRANIQIRGVDAERHGELIGALRALGLIDASADAESRRNVLVTPFADDEAMELSRTLEAALVSEDAPQISGKFGFVVDTGKHPVLQEAPGDIRLEQSSNGDLLLCADGCASGRAVSADSAISEAMDLARYFVRKGGIENGRGRMGPYVQAGHALPEGFEVPRQQTTDSILPGIYPQGALVALAFGQMRAETMAKLSELGPLRMTPWRMVLIESAQMPDLPEIITTADDPLLRVTACTGSPRCGQALGETRGLARRLAPLLPQDKHLHVSGCTKGCAHPRAAPLTVVASAQGYNLIRAGSAAAPPEHLNLTPDQIEKTL